ncbi:hypothetical protein MRB53_023824 [Persea americana]|uniref:Uncharacterized protein n=1 Tax=Persea americana TaxID=3435 RepID=A0ACC2LBB8_PERAE|nr:hypothetical protein MRB53_023824 [Persea americana]
MGLLHTQLAAEWKRALKFVLTVCTVGGSKCGPQIQPSSVKKRSVVHVADVSVECGQEASDMENLRNLAGDL